MSFRDDGDAAFARADALQQEVDDYEVKVASLHERLARSESERLRLAKLAHEDEPPPACVAEATPYSAETIMILGAMLIVALFALVMVGAHHR